MPDPIEELRRYGEAVEAATAATEVGGPAEVDAPSVGTLADEVDLAESSADAGHSRRPWLIAAAVAVILALGATALVTRPDDRDTDDLEVVDDPAGETFGYGPGWHELDPGPLRPGIGEITVWTGEELIVVGGQEGKEGAAYDPTTRTWRLLPEPPFTDPPPPGQPRVGPSWQGAWTGEELVVVANTGTPTWEAAAYDPASDAWRRLPDPPAEITDGPGPEEPDTVWTGSEVLFMSRLVSYVPATDAWTVYPGRELTDPSTTGGDLGDTMNPIWAGDRVVFVDGEGQPTEVFEPVTRTWTELDPTPLVGTQVIGSGTILASGVWDGERAWVIDDSGSSAAFDPATGTWDSIERRSLPPERSMCETQAVLMQGEPLLAACGAMFQHQSGGAWTRHDLTGEGGPAERGGSIVLISTGDALLAWEAGYGDIASRLRLWVPPPEAGGSPSTTDGSPPSDPSATTSPPSSPQSEPPLDSTAGPAITVIAGDVEGNVAPVGGYCWIDDILERCAADQISDTELSSLLSIEPGGQLHVVLPEAGTIRSDLPWDASGENCGRLERTIAAAASTPTLITGTIPSGTHTVSFDLTVGDDTHRYEVTLDAGEGPVCTDEARRSQARLLPDFELFGLTREELAAEFGEWRDVTHGRADPPELLELDVAFEDGRVRFAEISFSGRLPILEGVEALEDLPYLGLTIDEATDRAAANDRQYCVWGQACRFGGDPVLVFHAAEVGDETRVIGVYRS